MIDDETTEKISLNIEKGTELTRFQKMSNALRESIFSLVYTILKDERETTLTLTHLSWFFELFLLHQFVFHPKLIDLWNSPYTSSLAFRIFYIFNLSSSQDELISFNFYIILLYVVLSFIVLVTVDMIVVLIRFRKKKKVPSFALILLNISTGFSFSVFFLIITEILLLIFNCTYDSTTDGYVHKNFTDYRCFENVYFIHALLSGFFYLLFVTKAVVFTSINYESRLNSSNILAKYTSKAEIFMIFLKIILQGSFMILSNEWILILVQAILALILGYLYVIKGIYQNMEVGKAKRMMILLYVWSVTVLVALKVFEGMEFEGGLSVWTAGCPFVIIFAWGFSSENMNQLNKVQLKFRSPSHLVIHVRAVLLQEQNHSQAENNNLILFSYIQKHNLICPDPKCYLKELSGRNSNGMRSGIEWNEMLIKTMQVIVEGGIAKFPYSVELRICYATLLLDRLNNKKKAIEELTIAESFKPNFIESFIIFRLKRLIDEQSSSENDEGVSVVGMIAFEVHMTRCFNAVLHATDLQRKFWSELLQDKPRLSPMADIGEQLNLKIKAAKESWQNIYKMRSKAPAFVKLYAKFLIVVSNERELGQNIIEQFHLMLKKTTNNGFLALDGESNDVYRHPSVTLSITEKEVGKIKAVSKQFCALLGYTEDELLKEKMEVYISNLHKSYRYDFISEFFNAETLEKGQMEYVEKLSFLKKKNGTLIPVSSSMKLFQVNPTSFDGSYFVHTVKPIDLSINQVFFLVNRKGFIYDLTSNAETFFNIPISQQAMERQNIKSIMPYSALIMDHFRNKGLETSIVRNGKAQKVNLSVNPLKGGPLTERFLLGYIVKFVIPLQKIEGATRTVFNSRASSRHMVGVEDIWNILSPTSEFSKIPLSVKLMKKIRERRKSEIVIVDTIITKRLWKGAIEDRFENKLFIDQFSQKEDENKINKSKSVFREFFKEESERNEMLQNNNRKNLLIKMISKREMTFVIKFFIFLSVVWITMICTLSFLSTDNFNTAFNSLNSYYNRLNEGLTVTESTAILLTHLSSLTTLMATNNQTTNATLIEINKIEIANIKTKMEKVVYSIMDVEENFAHFNETVIELMVKEESYQNLKHHDYLNGIGDFNLDFAEMDTNYDRMSLFSRLKIKIMKVLWVSLLAMRKERNEFQVSYFLFRFVINYLTTDVIFDQIKDINSFFNDTFLAIQNSFFINNNAIQFLFIHVILSFAFLTYYLIMKCQVKKKIGDILILFLSIPKQDVKSNLKKCESIIQMCDVC